MSSISYEEISSRKNDDFFHYAQRLGFGELHTKYDAATGLRAIIAIHDTTLGPALGGCRFIHYQSSSDAIVDAMRLAEGMTYKAAIAGLPLGGGKSVIIRPDNITDRPALFKSFGKFIQDLGGRYITAQDSGSTEEDIAFIHQATSYVAGTPSDHPHELGDPSPFTALGVKCGIEAAVKFKLGKNNLQGIHVAIQGLGSVGFHLAELLHEMGAKLTVTDKKEEACQRAATLLGATVVDTDKIYDVECDVFAPCALGASINDETIKRLQCKIVAGAANNQLAEPIHGDELKEHNILYAPDYVINAGGLIQVAISATPITIEIAKEKILRIHDTLLSIFERADTSDGATSTMTDIMAKEIIENAKKDKG